MKDEGERVKVVIADHVSSGLIVAGAAFSVIAAATRKNSYVIAVPKSVGVPCNSCGAETPQGAEFCPFCGAKMRRGGV